MKKAIAVCGAMAIALTAAVVSAQAPNIAGKWTVDAEKNAAANPNAKGGRGGGGDMTIAQDASTVTITRTTQAGEQKTVYKTDGSEFKITMPGRGGAAVTEVSATAKWDGDKLVITQKGANGDQVTSWYMDGANLVSERAGQNGPMKTFYKKAM